VAAVQYTVTHKQYTEQHSETEYTERNIWLTASVFCMTRGVRINLKLGDRKEKKAGKICIIRNFIEGARRKASLGWANLTGMSSAELVTRDGAHAWLEELSDNTCALGKSLWT
jgi:hypothetical protein